MCNVYQLEILDLTPVIGHTSPELVGINYGVASKFVSSWNSCPFGPTGFTDFTFFFIAITAISEGPPVN